MIENLMKKNNIIVTALAVIVIVFCILLSSKQGLTPLSEIKILNFVVTKSNTMDKTELISVNYGKTSLSVPMGTQTKTSIEGKTAKEVELNKLAAEGREIFSEKELYEELIRRGADITPDMAERMKNEIMTSFDREIVNAIMGALYSADENFNIELKQYNNFQELKAAADFRSRSTGEFYGNQMLNELMAYKGASASELIKLLHDGAVLPENMISHIIFSKNIDLALDLKKSGYNINANYYDKFSSMNALELQANLFTINPYADSSEEQIIAVDKLIELGVPLKVNDGTRDALDLVLQGIPDETPEQAEKLFLLARHLHSQGLALEQSHLQLLERIKIQQPELHFKYVQDFQ